GEVHTAAAVFADLPAGQLTLQVSNSEYAMEVGATTIEAAPVWGEYGGAAVRRIESLQWLADSTAAESSESLARAMQPRRLHTALSSNAGATYFVRTNLRLFKPVHTAAWHTVEKA